MSPTAEDAVTSITQDHSTENEPATRNDGSEEDDESALDSYITEDNQIAPDIIDGLRSNDQTARLDAATKLHRLVDRRETTSAQAIINSGLIPDIVAMISLDDAELQVPLGFVLAFLTAGSSENISAVVEAGALAKFILIASSSTSDRARDYALLSLGNLGACSQLLSDRVIQEGGLKPPLDILGNPSKQKDSHNYWAAGAIAGITHQLSPDVAGYELHIREIITILAKYIEFQQDETAGSLEASLLALSYISSNAAAIDTVLEGGIIPRIVQLCSSKQASARHSALQCVGYILYSDDGANQLIKAGVLEALKACIGSEDAQDCRLACWAASSIVASTLEQARALINAGLIPLLIKVISNSESTETRGDAAWALAGLACNWGHYYQDVRETLLEENCLEGLLSALKLTDQSAVAMSMKGLLRFVKTPWPGRPKAIERIEAAGGVATLRAFKLRPEANLAHERYVAHTILKEHLKQHTHDIITIIAKYIEYKQEETAGSLRYSLLALSHISSNVSVIDTVLETGVIPRIVQLCSSEQGKARHTALECVANILYSSNGTKHLTKAGVIVALRACLTSEDAQDRIYACWAATNIAAITSTLEQAEAMMEAGFVPLLVKAISNSEEEAEARNYAVWALAGLAYNWGQTYLPVRQALLDAGCVEGFLSALALKDQGPASVSMKSLLVFMETWGTVKQDAMERIKAVGGVAVLRAFKLRPEAELAHERHMALDILKKYLKQDSLPPRV